jgi:hypothetical protein
MIGIRLRILLGLKLSSRSADSLNFECEAGAVRWFIGFREPYFLRIWSGPRALLRKRSERLESAAPLL